MSDPRPIEPLARPPHATVAVPGSKSLTNRALLCAAMAPGTTVLDGALRADDTEAMVRCLAAGGVACTWGDDDSISVAGGGGLAAGGGVTRLDAGLSGTTSRFLLPVLAASPGRWLLDGDEPLRRRPFGPLLGAVRELGAMVVERGAEGCLPLEVTGRQLDGGSTSVPGDVTSQFVSALLLAGPLTAGGIDLDVEGDVVSEPYVEMTRHVMASFGAPVDGSRAPGGGYTSPGRYRIEPDASAASYLLAAAAVTGGEVTVAGLGTDSLQGDAGFATEVLAAMGCTVEQTADATTVRGPGAGGLRGIVADLRSMPDMAQTLAAVAVFADGPTEVHGVGIIRGHETDRIAAVVTELRRLGVEADELDDGFRVVPAPVRAATVETYDDHRMAMAFAVVGLAAPGVSIADPGCVAKTFPRFFETLDRLR